MTFSKVYFYISEEDSNELGWLLRGQPMIFWWYYRLVTWKLVGRMLSYRKIHIGFMMNGWISRRFSKPRYSLLRACSNSSYTGKFFSEVNVLHQGKPTFFLDKLSLTRLPSCNVGSHCFLNTVSLWLVLPKSFFSWFLYGHLKSPVSASILYLSPLCFPTPTIWEAPPRCPSTRQDSVSYL